MGEMAKTHCEEGRAMEEEGSSARRRLLGFTILNPMCKWHRFSVATFKRLKCILPPFFFWPDILPP